MAHNGFGQFLPAEPTAAQVRRSPGYRQGFGRHLDGSLGATNLKRSQLAAQRRERIATAQRAGAAEYDRSGRPLDPLRDDPEAIDVEWHAEFGPRDED